MNDEISISVQGVSKCYRMYQSQIARVKELLHPKKAKYHKEFWALRDISFEVPKATTFGIVGQNGSGKSTLLQIISGIIRPTNGNVLVNGRISALLELGAGFHNDFTGRENVFMQGALMGISRSEMESHFDSIEQFADIGSFIDQPVKTYSSGMYVRLAFATAINVDPDILIIDEILAVGDDMFRRRCYRKLEEFKEQGKTILFVSHNLLSITSICDRALLLDRGRLLNIGPQKQVVNAYSKLQAEKEAEYVKKLQHTNKNAGEETPDTLIKPLITDNLFGTGEAEIIDFHILDDRGSETTILSIGQRYKFITKVMFKKDVLSPDIGMNIITLTGIQIYGICPMIANIPMQAVDTGTTIVAEFDLINNLNPGTYSININVSEHLDQKRVFLRRHLDIQTFKVAGDTRSYGLVDMNAKISIEKE